MTGIDEVLVVFDVSGSFHELGKQHLLEYLGDAIANAEEMDWFQVQLRMYTWSDKVIESDDIPPVLSGHGTAEVKPLKQFLANVTNHQAVLLISDGLFGIFRDKSLMLLTQNMGRRFQIIAAGYDADISTLKKMSKNVQYAENMVSILRIMTEKKID